MCCYSFKNWILDYCVALAVSERGKKCLSEMVKISKAVTEV